MGVFRGARRSHSEQSGAARSILWNVVVATTPSALLVQARALEGHTQESLAKRLGELFPSVYAGGAACREVISKWERNRNWRPRRATWIRLQAALAKLPELP